MKMTTDNLQKLEVKINKAYSKGNPELFFETKRGSKYSEQWRMLMNELRGWDEGRWDNDGKDLTKESWLQYCKGKALHPYYTIGDVCA